MPKQLDRGQFKRLGVGAIEEYAEFLPPGAKPDTIKKPMPARRPSAEAPGEKLMYAPARNSSRCASMP